MRYHPKTHFCPDATRPAQTGQDAQGRTWVQDWGWFGSEQAKQRRFVRRLTLHRPGEETIILLTDLLDAAQFPANDLFDLYLARWSIERVFQQITEVFHLQTLIGTTPQGSSPLLPVNRSGSRRGTSARWTAQGWPRHCTF